jgi:hypothetical protein
MKKIVLLGISLMIIMLNSCQYMKNVQLLNGGELFRKDFVQSVPFELRKDLIVIKARVNDDSLDSEFIFDTGAFNSKIEKSLAEHHGLRTIARKSNSTASGISRNIEVTRIDSFKLGETQFYNISAGKLEYDENSASQCIAPHGIIGANLMKLAHWKIDYNKQLLYFSDKAFEPDSDKNYRISFSHPLLSGTPEIDLEIEDKRIQNILFDVGYNGGLILPYEFADEFDGDASIFIDRSTTGIYGSKTDTLKEKWLKVNIGGFSTTIPVNFSANGKALLGNEYLKHFEVIINYDDDYILLSPVREIKIEKNLTFIPGILNDSLWIVNRCTPDSPYSLGDTLEYFQGKKPFELFSDHCDYLMNIRSILPQEE